MQDKQSPYTPTNHGGSRICTIILLSPDHRGDRVMKNNKLDITEIIAAELGGRTPQLLWYISPTLVNKLPISAIENLTSAPSMIIDIGRLNDGGILISIEAARCSIDSLEQILGALGALYGITPAEVV